MSSPQPPSLVPMLLSVPPASPEAPTAAPSCQEWQQSHQLVFHLGNLSLLLGLLVPTTLRLQMIALRLLLMTGECGPPSRSRSGTSPPELPV